MVEEHAIAGAAVMTMKTLLLATALLAGLMTSAQARTFHYACQSGENRYALTVNTDRNIVTLVQRSPTRTLATFRILKVSPECAKYGWTLSDGAEFCTATQGVGSLDWDGREFDCDQADTN
jgi:hypothetical protein